MKTVFTVNDVVVGHASAHQQGVTVACTIPGATAHELPDDSPVDSGWKYANGEFSPPDPVPPRVGPDRFKLLFTPAERIKAKSLRATDENIADFWELLDDPRTDVVDLALSSIQQAVAYTLSKVKANGVDLDVQQRLAQILTGELV